MDKNWSRISQDFQITTFFLASTVTIGLVFVWTQSVGAKSTATLWAFASLAVGGLVGFLFGIPRVLQDSNTAPRIQPAPNEEGDQPLTRLAYRMQVNTNLEQISDWLTKIIVGIGLIELRNLPDYLGRLSLFIAGGLGALPQAQVLAIALVLYFSVIGFLGGYLVTRIYLAQAFSRADWGAQNTILVAGAELTLTEVSEQSRNLLADLQDQVLNLQKVSPQAPSEKTLDESSASTAPHVRSILWVDDNPKNNSFLLERLTKLGIEVAQVLSTEDAFAKLKARSFDRIISDMGRIEHQGYNRKAGIDLIRALRSSGIETPVVIYCSARAVADFGQEAIAEGGEDVTSSPTALLKALKIEA